MKNDQKLDSYLSLKKVPSFQLVKPLRRTIKLFPGKQFPEGNKKDLS